MKMERLFKGKIVVVVISVLVACTQFSGCDRNTQEKTKSVRVKMIEPAMILSKEDARVLTGVSFGECTVKEEPRVGMKLCVYEQEGAFLQVGLTQTAFLDKKSREAGNTPLSLFTSIKGALKDAAKIEGVGDDNFLLPPGLHILKGDYYITVSLGLMAKDQEKLKAAGMKAVANLGKYSAQ